MSIYHLDAYGRMPEQTWAESLDLGREYDRDAQLATGPAAFVEAPPARDPYPFRYRRRTPLPSHEVTREDFERWGIGHLWAGK